MKQTYKVLAAMMAPPEKLPPLDTWKEVEAENTTEAADIHRRNFPGFPFVMVAWQSGSGFETLFSVIHNQPVYTVETFENGHPRP